MNFVEEEILKIQERLEALEQLAVADIKRVAREEARRVCEEELAELRDEL